MMFTEQCTFRLIMLMWRLRMSVAREPRVVGIDKLPNMSRRYTCPLFLPQSIVLRGDRSGRGFKDRK